MAWGQVYLIPCQSQAVFQLHQGDASQNTKGILFFVCTGNTVSVSHHSALVLNTEPCLVQPRHLLCSLLQPQGLCTDCSFGPNALFSPLGLISTYSPFRPKNNSHFLREAFRDCPGLLCLPLPAVPTVTVLHIRVSAVPPGGQIPVYLVHQSVPWPTLLV